MNLTCPVCGNPTSPEDSFCNICGNRLPQKAEVKHEDVPEKRCKKCGEQLLLSDAYCPLCGSPQTNDDFEEITTDQPTANIDNELPAERETLSQRNNVTEDKTVVNEKNCPVCGNKAIAGEKYCIKCGAMLEEETNSTETSINQNSSLQDAIDVFFHKNSVLSLFVRFAWFFALYFPIYAMISHINSLSGLFGILENFSVIMHYLYLIGLIALFGNRKYLLLISALVLRAINSIWAICISTEPISSVERLLVLLPLIAFLCIRFSKTPEFFQLKSKINAFRSN